MNEMWKGILTLTLKLCIKLIEVVIGKDIDGDKEIGA